MEWLEEIAGSTESLGDRIRILDGGTGELAWLYEDEDSVLAKLVTTIRPTPSSTLTACPLTQRG